MELTSNCTYFVHHEAFEDRNLRGIKISIALLRRGHDHVLQAKNGFISGKRTSELTAAHNLHNASGLASLLTLGT